MAKRQKVSTLVNRATGNRIKLGGYRPSNGKKPPKFNFYASTRFQEDQLPHRVDLRPHMTTVENQSQLNSCVANSMAGAYEYLAKRATGNAGDVSRLFIYYNARAYDGIKGDDGCMIASAIQVLQEHGACAETTWAYDEANVNVQPPDPAYHEARNFLVEEADELKQDIFAMKHCLAEGFPFAFGLKLFRSFDQAAKHGIVPMPDQSEDGRTAHGWHAMLCVGYSDQSQAFIIRNSWGEDWGDRGYCYVPYAYMTNAEWCNEMWAVRAVSDVDFSRDVWVEQDFAVADMFDDLLDLGSEDSSYEYEYEYEECDDEDSEETENSDSESTENGYQEYSEETVDSSSESYQEEYSEETESTYVEYSETSVEYTETTEESYEVTEEYSEESYEVTEEYSEETEESSEEEYEETEASSEEEEEESEEEEDEDEEEEDEGEEYDEGEDEGEEYDEGDDGGDEGEEYDEGDDGGDDGGDEE